MKLTINGQEGEAHMIWSKSAANMLGFSRFFDKNS